MTKILIDRAVVEQALEALEMYAIDTDSEFQRKAIADLRAALAQDQLHDQQLRDDAERWRNIRGYVEAMEDEICALRSSLRAALAEPVQEPVQEAGCRDDGMPTSAEERHLRRLLALRAAMPHAYYDDGEAQGTEHGISIDFMREPVAHIDAKLRALNVARAIAKQAEPAQEPDSPARRCGGPGCDMRCCQPVEEPVASAGLGPLPEPAQPAEPEGYMPGCLWPLPATPDYYTAEQMREYALRALAKPVQEPKPVAWVHTNGTSDTKWHLPQRPAEPQGCDHCNHPLYAAVKCKVCGRAT